MGTIYRCLIIDDETPAHKALASHISKFDDLEHTASAYTGKDALKMLNEQHFDIIFLDINMPVISGVEVMELQPNRPLTIVTTAYTDHALSAYENDAIAYLLKPISLANFSKAVDKARVYYSGYSNTKGIQEKQVYSFKLNGETYDIPLNDIIYIESFGNYVKLYRKTARQVVVIHGTLSGITEELANSDFIQVHRTFVVNKSYVSEVHQNTLTLTNGLLLPVGRKYKILLSNL